jgi:hypothetical protein
MALPGILGEIGAEPLFTGLTSLFGGAAANVSREQQSSRQMQFQERMSSTAYQRAMQDMREAGLNPMLAAKVGPASSPVGAMANIQDIGTPAAQAATSAYQASTQRDVGESQVELNKEQQVVARQTGQKIAQETLNARTQGDVIAQSVRLLKAQIEQVGQQTALSRENVKLIVEQIKKTKADVIMMNIDAKNMAYIDDLAAAGNTVMQFLSLIIRALK